MKNPLVTVIIPTFNYQVFLPDTLRSVLMQKYQNFEVIVIDDGSTDQTKDIVSEFIKVDARIKYFYQNNGGLSSARNLGIEKSKGEYIQFLDADDLLSDLKIELQLEKMESDSSIDVSYTEAYYFLDGNSEKYYKTLALTQESWMPKLNSSGNTILEELIKQNIMPVNAALIRASSLHKIGLFDQKMKSLEDWNFWLSGAFRNFHFAFLLNEDAFALIRVHNASMSHNKQKMYENELILRNRVKILIENCGFIIPTQKKSLKKINSRNIKIILSWIIQESKGSASKTFNLIRLSGFLTFFGSFLKMMNDKRKGS